MSAKVQDEQFDNISTLGVDEKKSWNERFHELKRAISQRIISVAYRCGLGYTSLAESYNEYNSNLFREIMLKAQISQQTDESQLFHFIAKGNVYEVELELKRIKAQIHAFVWKHMAYASASQMYDEVEKRTRSSTIYRRDVSGATIVLLAYELKHYRLGRYLVTRYPRLASLPYSGKVDSLMNFVMDGHKHTLGARNLRAELNELRKRMGTKTDAAMEVYMPYTGKNILHMCIMRRNYEEVRWLLDFYRDHRHSYPDCLGRLLNTEAVGKFFDRSGSFYVGSNPLQFAVCSNSTAIFDLVYSFLTLFEESGEGADDDSTLATSAKHPLTGPDVIFATDKFGNNVLHLCVLHGLDYMYQHVYEKALHVTKRKVHQLYIDHSGSAWGHSTAATGFTLGSEVDEEGQQGYRLHDKILRLPQNFEQLAQWTEAEAKRKVDERLVLALNNDLHSPLTLAAFIINKKRDSEELTAQRVEMLRFLVDKTKHKLWEYGPVTMSIMDLDGIEIKYDVLGHYSCAGREKEVSEKTVHSAICWLCIHDSDKAISIPEIDSIIQAKWERVGYPYFVLSFLIHSFLTAGVTLILIFINATPTLHTSYGTEIVADLLYTVVGVSFLLMLLQEVHDWLRFGFRWHHCRGVALYDKVLRLVKILSFLSLLACKIVAANRHTEVGEASRGGAHVVYNVHDDEGIKVSIVVCVIASYFHLYYYFMGFDSTGPFVLTMFRIISSDVPYFLNFYMLVVISTACALSVLSSGLNPTAGYGFGRLVTAIWTLIQDTVSMQNATHDHINNIALYPKHLQWLADIILTFYYVTVIIMMLNLLIAMISSTYAAYTSYSRAILQIAKYNIMNAMEWVMWPSELRFNRSKYTRINAQTELQTLKDGAHKVLRRRRRPPQQQARLRAQLPSLIAAVSQKYRFREPAQRRTPLAGEPSGRQWTREDTEREVQVKYLFELQTTDLEWFTGKKVGNPVATISPPSPSTRGQLPFVGACGNDAALTTGRETTDSTLSNRKTTVFIINPQVDFHPGGTLAIDNAAADSERIANMIDSYGDDIHDIFVSMNSRHPCHIAHAVSWHRKDAPHEHPEPFTRITNADVLNGVWVYGDGSEDMQAWAQAYTGALERRDRMVLTIWPEHCIIGSAGHSVVPNINAALQRWAERSNRPINYVMKGQNLRVEMYSALQADVHDPLDQNTSLNHELLSMLKTSDRLLVCGQAMSHCVNFTTRDLMDHWDKSMASIVLLTDGSSPLEGYEAEAEEFKRHCMRRGVTLSNIKEAFSGSKPRVLSRAVAAQHAFAGKKYGW